MVAGVILNGLNSGLQRLDCDFECDLPCLCNLYGFCFGFSQYDIVQFHILVNSVQVSGFKFFKNITIYVHRNRDVLVTEYFLQDLRRHAAFDAARGKGMTERVEGQLSLQRFVLNNEPPVLSPIHSFKKAAKSLLIKTLRIPASVFVSLTITELSPPRDVVLFTMIQLF